MCNVYVTEIFVNLKKYAFLNIRSNLESKNLKTSPTIGHYTGRLIFSLNYQSTFSSAILNLKNLCNILVDETGAY